MAIIDLLRDCPLFYELYDKEIEKLVKHCSVYTLDEGEQIVNEGDKGDEIFVVLDGEMSIQRVFKEGKVEIQRLRPGDVFGEMAFMSDPIRSADVVAATGAHIT